jgi:hypothetical protein
MCRALLRILPRIRDEDAGAFETRSHLLDTFSRAMRSVLVGLSTACCDWMEDWHGAS